MNPQNNEAGMQLPPPVMEQAPVNGVPGESHVITPEQAAVSGAEHPTGPQFSAMPAPASIPLPITPSLPAGASSAVSGTTQSQAQLTADDGDLIEKEWVLKAKAIVDSNREDPYKQSEELTAVKVDYMKQRYNKIIKLN